MNLEDIAAPRCFEIERRLRDELDIPVFHDDQHGTAIVVLAALINALRVVDKLIADVRIVISGVGAAGHAIIQLLRAQGASHIVACSRKGAIHSGETYTDEHRQWIAENTNPEGFSGSLVEALAGADVFIGVSAPDLITADDVATMAQDSSIVLALANPDPEIHPAEAAKHAAVVATGRSDFPNQINNVLAFPGLFRGLLDAAAREITNEMLVAAAEAIADCVSARRTQRELHRAQRLRRPGRARGGRCRRGERQVMTESDVALRAPGHELRLVSVVRHDSGRHTPEPPETARRPESFLTPERLRP